MDSSILGPQTITWNGTHYRTLLPGRDSGGAMSVLDTLSPAGSGPPRHIHHDADEIFVLLSGDCEFWVAGDSFFRGPGQVVFVPRGTEHSFRVPGPDPCRHLLILTPSGFEGFFDEMAGGAYLIPRDMERIAQIAETFHLTFTGPPLAGQDATEHFAQTEKGDAK